MRNLHLLDACRRTDRFVRARFGGIGDHETGVFEVPSPIDHQPMLVIASAGAGWDHVSVSRRNRCPNWIEMSTIKALFFRDDETVMQLHVPTTEHVNDHPNCLHLWRPQKADIPRPPGWMVGGVTKEEGERLAREAEAANAD